MANRRFTSERLYSFHAMAVMLDCQFTVDATNNKGITGLKSPGISSVYMHTSTTPATGNPNPASGIILVNFQDNYRFLYDSFRQFQPPVTGSGISISGSSVLTVGAVYQIVTVGTSTAANWQAVGLPTTVTPAVGVTFVASATGSGTGTGTVKALTNSGIVSIEVMGNPSLTLVSNRPNTAGGYLFLQCLGATNSSTTTLIPTAPTAGTIISLSFILSNSSVVQQGD